jgi:hypothetical protein
MKTDKTAVTDSRTVASKLKKLAKLLTYKADIYGPNGRIYACDAAFTVQNGKLFHGQTEIDPTTLRDGNGNPIS